MTSTTKRREHSSKTVARARELRAAEWTYRRIAELLTEETGRTVHFRTVQLWCNERAARTHRDNDLATRARKRLAAFDGRLGRGITSPEKRWLRIVALHEAGLSCEAVAKVMRLDFGLELNESTVRYSLAQGKPPRSLRGRS